MASGPSGEHLINPDDTRLPVEMARDKTRLEILLETPTVQLKGLSFDVEPANLAGHVVLYLAEATAIKEITLCFRGKARLISPSSDAFSLNTVPVTQILCSRDWSFLEGEKHHSHTLQAGRHLFPFQMSIPPTLPSTIFSPAFGGTSIKYKLRAQAVRAGFHQNLQATRLVPILRSLPSEAMEYQQTLEIENSWPNKLMYSVILPHKAWAVGDKITAILKCSPLTKGVAVLAVESSIVSHTIITARSGSFKETTKVVAQAKHDIVNGRAIESPESYFGTSSPHSSTNPPTSPTPAHPRPPHRRQHTAPASTNIPTLSGADRGPSTSTSDSTQPEDLESSDLILKITLPVRSTVTPSHDVEPITVAHRIRWHITISNPDGHISELRCSLPIRLLDHHLLAESRDYSGPSRRLLLGDGDSSAEHEEEEVFLPSYSAHIRDRVANMYLSDSAAVRISNPWVSNGASPTFGLNHLPPSSRTSGYATPLEQHGHFLERPCLPGTLPHQPGASAHMSLDWVNTELLLSLSGGQPLRAWPPPPDVEMDTKPHPPRVFSGGENSPPADRDHPSSSTTPHESSSRTMHSLFHNSIKPFASSAFHPTSWLPRSQSWQSSQSFVSHYTNNQHSSSRGDPERAHGRQSRDSPAHEMASSVNRNAPMTSAVLLHRAFTETPDYAVAARGFLGGVPPLTSMEGLPSYEETQRVTFESAPQTPAVEG